MAEQEKKSDKTSVQQEDEKLKERMHELEEDPPQKLEDWPDDELKYETFGGKEGDHSYEEGPERQLGPSSLQRHEDGSITIEGEEVDNPDDYKMEPLEGIATQTGEDEGEGEDEDEKDD